jgi:hypothetical protein
MNLLKQLNFMIGIDVVNSKLLLVEVSVKIAQHTQDQTWKKLSAFLRHVVRAWRSWLMEHAINAIHIQDQDQMVKVAFIQHAHKMDRDKELDMTEPANNVQTSKEASIFQSNVKNHLVVLAKDFQEKLFA